MSSDAVIYEVRLDIAEVVASNFELWLTGHIEKMLCFDGFESAEVISPESARPGVQRRIVRYRVGSRAQLDDYLREHSEGMRADGADRFGEHLQARRDIYPVSAPTHNTGLTCSNCGTTLTGQYCALCGQREKHRIISLWGMIRELTGDLFEVDARVWRTIIPLITRPGHLTAEYLRGRRVHYTPPIRLYLVTSLMFFLVAFFDTQIGSVTAAGDGDARVVAPVVVPGPAAPAADISSSDPEPDVDDDSDEISDIRDFDCNKIDSKELGVGDGIARRIDTVCRKLTADDGPARFVGSFVDNLPGMMLIFLPFMALVLKLMYALSRRYYVEHLLFLLHFHSFFFLASTVVMLVSRIPSVVPGQGLLDFLLTAAMLVYSPLYLFRAMRLVYGQSGLVRSVKFLAFTAIYFVTLLTLFTALSIMTALTL